MSQRKPVKKEPGNGSAQALTKEMAHIKNLNDLQRVLCDQIEGVINGTVTPQNVNAVTNASGKIISISKMRLEVAKAVGKQFEAEDVTKIHERKQIAG